MIKREIGIIQTKFFCDWNFLSFTFLLAILFSCYNFYTKLPFSWELVCSPQSNQPKLATKTIIGVWLSILFGANLGNKTRPSNVLYFSIRFTCFFSHLWLWTSITNGFNLGRKSPILGLKQSLLFLFLSILKGKITFFEFLSNISSLKVALE